MADDYFYQLWSLRPYEWNCGRQSVRLRALSLLRSPPDSGDVPALRRTDSNLKCTAAYCSRTTWEVARDTCGTAWRAAVLRTTGGADRAEHLQCRRGLPRSAQDVGPCSAGWHAHWRIDRPTVDCGGVRRLRPYLHEVGPNARRY